MQPQGVNIQPQLITVAPAGAIVQPQGALVAPVDIAIAPVDTLYGPQGVSLVFLFFFPRGRAGRGRRAPRASQGRRTPQRPPPRTRLLSARNVSREGQKNSLIDFEKWKNSASFKHQVSYAPVKNDLTEAPAEFTFPGDAR